MLKKVILITFLISFSFTNASAAPRVIPKVVPTALNFYKNTDENSSTFLFTKVVFDVPRTKSLGEIGIRYLIKGCDDYKEYKMDSQLFGVQTRLFADNFNKILSENGYNAKGNENILFGEDVPPEYLVAARITDFETSLCHSIVSEKLKGKLYLKLNWQVYNNAQKKVVLNQETEGYYDQKKFIESGFDLLLKNAFNASVYNFLSDKAFVELLSSGEGILVDENFDSVLVNYASADVASEKRDFNTIEHSVVGVKTASGTGSGFIISQDGFILTNHHVVDGYETVSIVLANGIEIDGNVIRSAPKRDVALVKIPIKKLKPVLIQKTIPTVGSQAFAMGSPIRVEFQGTLSSGIISALRKDEDGYDLIQSDTNITFGNSGGPMFDENGHVIAISVAGSREVDFANYFIPVQSALDTLNIKNSSSD